MYDGILPSPNLTPSELARATQTDMHIGRRSEEQTASQLRSTMLLLPDYGQIRPQPDYATAIHFPAAVCHKIDLSS